MRVLALFSRSRILVDPLYFGSLFSRDCHWDSVIVSLAAASLSRFSMIILTFFSSFCSIGQKNSSGFSTFCKLKQIIYTRSLAYGTKVLLQLLSAFPYFVGITLALKPFLIIGYLHLFTLAFMSVFLIFIYYKLRLFEFVKKLSKSGVIIFLLGIFSTEFILFLQGFLVIVEVQPLVYYNQLLLIFSITIVLGLLVIFVQQFYKSNKRSA